MMKPRPPLTRVGSGPGAPSAPSPITDIAHFSRQEANYKSKVTDYLLKRGFTKTEAIFRQESRNLGPDGKPVHVRAEDLGTKQYTEAFNLLREWIEKNLDIYKVKYSFAFPIKRINLTCCSWN